MDFSKLKLNEGIATGNNYFAASEKAIGNAATGGEMQKQGTASAKQKQKDQRSQNATPMKSGTTFASEQLMRKKEIIKMREDAKCDWRKEIMEAANPNDDPDHPFVEVMPFNDYKMKEAMKNMKKAAVKDGKEGQLTQGMQQESAVGYADPQNVKQKKKSGKAVAKGKDKKTVNNPTNTATPKENAKRRQVNAIPAMRGTIGKQMTSKVTTDAFDD